MKFVLCTRSLFSHNKFFDKCAIVLQRIQHIYSNFYFGLAVGFAGFGTLSIQIVVFPVLIVVVLVLDLSPLFAVMLNTYILLIME